MIRVLMAVLFAALAAGQVKLPEYTRQQLPNGAVLLLLPKAGAPLVHFRVVIKGGAEAEPASIAGVASATAALLRKGTAKRSASQFSSDLDLLGGEFNAAASESATVITAEFLSKDFDAGLELLTDALLHPSFPEQETTKELGLRLDRAKALKDNAQASIGSYARAAFFGNDHPYGQVASEVTIARIQRDDILAYYKRLYAGRNLIVAVTGNFDPAQARAKLQAAFGQMPAGDAYAWRPAPQLPRRAQLLLVDKPDATQTYFRIAQPGVDRKSPDGPVLDVVNTLFGGRFTSMLNDELRVNSGLTYGASSGVDRLRLPGAISIASYTRTETTVEAIDLALAILKRLGETGLTAEQLASAKAYIKGTFPTSRLESLDQLANAVSELELLGLGRDDIDGYFARIDGVTVEAANAAARQYYRPDTLSFVLLGAAGKIREGVRKYGELRKIQASAPGFGVR